MTGCSTTTSHTIHTSQGPTYSLKVDGGSCEINDDGSVECDQPTIKLTTTPFICNLPYREAASLEVCCWAVVLAEPAAWPWGLLLRLAHMYTVQP